MFETMYATRGIGLAAQQVAEALQVTVLDVREASAERPSTLELNGEPADVHTFMPLVLILKIHCCAVGSQRNAVSGVVETTSSLTTVLVSDICPISLNDVTTPDVPIELQFASVTRNLAGTVLPALFTLLPSGLIGCKIACVGSPKAVHDIEYITDSAPFWNVMV